jgi:cytochrome P450
VTDVFDPRVFARGVPHDALRQLRDTDPVSWQDEHEVGIWPAGPGYWAVTRYDDVRHVLRSPQDFSSSLGATQIRDVDPADLLGVPPADRALLLEWTNRVIGYQDPEHGVVVRDAEGKPVNPRSPAMLADMFGYAEELAERKRREPADDVMTALVHAEVPLDGKVEQLTDAELKMFFFLLVIAGNDTVRSALPGGVLALVRNPDAYRRLRAEPALLAPAIEEMLRVHPPVLTFRRTATRSRRETDKGRPWCRSPQRAVDDRVPRRPGPIGLAGRLGTDPWSMAGHLL